MEAKIHFLAISAEEFSKILTAPHHHYLSTLFDRHQWRHRIGFKFKTFNKEPAEIREILDRYEIPYFYTVILFSL